MKRQFGQILFATPDGYNFFFSFFSCQGSQLFSVEVCIWMKDTISTESVQGSSVVTYLWINSIVYLTKKEWNYVPTEVRGHLQPNSISTLGKKRHSPHLLSWHKFFSLLPPHRIIFCYNTQRNTRVWQCPWSLPLSTEHCRPSSQVKKEHERTLLTPYTHLVSD